MNEKRGPYISIFIGALLIIAGGVWILDELNIVNMPFYLFWLSVGKMWPLILIVIGICIIFRSRIITFIMTIIYILIVILGAYAMSGSINFPFFEKLDYFHHIKIEEKMNNVQKIKKLASTTQAELNLSAGIAGDIIIGSDDDIEYLLNFKSEFIPQMEVTDTSKKQTVDINYGNRRIKDSYFNLNKDVAWKVSLKSGASEIELNLEDINIEQINIESGASDIKGKLSDKTKKVNIEISSGASDIEFLIPKGSACEIVSSSAATNIKIDKTKISGIGRKTYRSDNYDSALNIFNFNISSGASDISISYY